MNAKEIERAAYIAAYQIITTNTTSPELACPGTRRSRALDIVAAIIRNTFEMQNQAMDQRPNWFDRMSESRPDAAAARRNRVLLELPQRTVTRREEPLAHLEDAVV